MSEYKGDIVAGSTIPFSFNTRDATGAPITLAGSPVISIYKNGNATEVTTGVSLAVDYDSRTGYHRVSVDTSLDGTFYAAGNDFYAVITTGTVSGTSVVGSEVGQFSIENRTQKADVRKLLGTAWVTPATPGRPDVNVGWINGIITSSVTTVNAVLGNAYTIVVDSTGRVNSFLVGILTSVFTETSTGLIAACFKQFFNITSPTSTANLITGTTNAPTAGDLTATMKASVTTAATAATPTAAAVTGNVGGNVVGSVGSVTTVTSIVNGVWGAILSGSTTAQTMVTAIWNWITAAGAYVSPTGASVNASQIGGVSATGVLSAPGVGSTAFLANAPGGSGGGSGAIAVTITVNDGSGNLLQNAKVTLSINSSVYFASTNSVGVVVLTPNEGNGTYGVAIQCGGFTFTPIPISSGLVVSGATSHTYSMTSTSPPAPSNGPATAYAYTYDATGTTIVTGVAFSYQMLEFPTGVTGVIPSSSPLTATSDSNGRLLLTGLLPSTGFVLTNTSTGASLPFTTGAANSTTAINGGIL